jgi:glycosyltransferase involved in cell wall biosynthesis
MPSVVIAAHNEESVIGACLDALLAQGVRSNEVVVVANGCTDLTAGVARERGVVVIDLPEPGKAGALNAGDAVAIGYPRIYLDADIVVPPACVASVLASFERVPGALAAVPRRRVNTAGRAWPVRAYFAVNTRLPAFEEGLFGRGMIALSAEGRSRFAEFPEMVADDLFLDAQFSKAEKAVTSDAEIVVDAPFATGDLLRRLVRVRRGNAQMRAAAAAGAVEAEVRPSQRWAWLRVTVGHPTLWTSAVTYAVITAIAGSRARRVADGAAAWGQDTSTRERSQAASDGGAP